MNRISSRLAFAALAALLAFDGSSVAAQTTFEACRVPSVGAIYMINVAGAPAACLDASHVAFSWTEGSGGVGPGAIGTTELADGAVTAAKIATDAVTGAGIAPDAVGSTQIADGAVIAAKIATDAVTGVGIAPDAVGSSEIADGTVSAADLGTGLFQWAQVSSGGSVLGSSGGATVLKGGTGIFNVTFPVSLGGQSNCAHVASSIQGALFLEVIHGDRFGGGQSTIQVRTYTSSVVLTDGAFNLAVICT